MRTPELLRKSHGFGLVELMVSMTLGLLLIGAVLQTLMASNASHRVQQSLAQVQEAGRYAIHFIGKDLRMAGYSGCASLLSISVNIIADTSLIPTPSDITLSMATAVTGVDNVDSNDGYPDAVPGTDVISLRRASTESARLVGNMAAENANIQIAANTPGLEAKDFVLISDCITADLFVANNVSESSGKVTITHPNSVNNTNRLSKAYGPEAEIFAFETVTFFVGDTGRTTQAGNPVRALFTARRTAATGLSTPQAYELIDGIEDMQVTYGEDTDQDGGIDAYVDADDVTNWESVLSVKVALLLVGDTENVAAKAGSPLVKPVVFNGAEQVFDDGRYRTVAVNVFALRNKMP